MTLSGDNFSIAQDDDESIEHWGNFKVINIVEDHIYLESKTTYLLPRKTMADEDFRLAKKIISEKVKQVDTSGKIK